MRASSVVLGLVSAVAACSALAQQPIGPPTEDNPVRHQPADPAVRLGDTPGMIVKFRSTSSAGLAQIQSSTTGEAATSAVVTRFAARAHVAVRAARALPAGMHALRIEPNGGESFAEQLARVRADPDVEFAVPDERRFPHAVPSDPLYTGQWYLQNVQPAAIHAETAWDTSVGTSGIVIAVIDTGILYGHPDLKRANSGGRVLPGYDFISDAAQANDGNGRDSDPTDAGDFITSAEDASGPFVGCGASGSSWHGTRTSGIIGALSNNSVGVTGITWNPWILPARGLGKCGGPDSDIIDAMAWAGGIHVPGVPDNPYPAKIENMSLGSSSTCPASYQAIISQLATRGVLVVASAGNEGGPVDTPANCPGVVAVTGLRHVGTKVGFASLGPEVALGAPGGNCVNTGPGQACLFSIDTTTNDGATTAGNNTYTDQFNFNVGTSFSAPIVSGIAGLMASVNGNLGAAQLLARLKEGATTPFPPPGTDSNGQPIPVCHVPVSQSDVQASECGCTTSTCGAGMANAVGALNAALRPIAAVVRPGSIVPGQPVALSGAGSAGACGRTIASYTWTVVSGTGSFNPPTGQNTTFDNAPTLGSVTVRLTVTDDVGKQDTADVVINPSSTSSSAPSNAGSNACPAAVPPPAPISITVAPAMVNVQAFVGTQAFTATVTNASNNAVTWQVNGVDGGNSTVGTISALGLYTAPGTVPTPATVPITAKSVEDPTRTGSAQVTVTPPPPISVTVAPATASVAAGGTQPFTATVTNASNTAVTWQVDGVAGGNSTVGTISVFGVYTAPATVPTPATVTVTAISSQDSTRMASAQVTITAPGTSSMPPSSGSGGGGGALDLLGLLCLVTFGRRFAPSLLRTRRAS